MRPAAFLAAMLLAVGPWIGLAVAQRLKVADLHDRLAAEKNWTSHTLGQYFEALRRQEDLAEIVVQFRSEVLVCKSMLPKEQRESLR